MKKTTAIIFAISLSIALVSTAYGETESLVETESLLETELSTENVENPWSVEDIVDDFDDPTGEYYLMNITSGRYSNNQVSDEELSVYTRYYPNYSNFSFELFEGQERAVHDEYSKLLLKIKIGETVFEYDLFPEAPYKDIYVSSEWDQDGFFTMWNNLLKGTDLRCVLYVDDHKYSFTIPSAGFSETAEPFNREKYDSAVKAFESGEYSYAEMTFSLLGGYSDAEDRALACKEKVREAKAVDDEKKKDSKVTGVEGFLVFDSEGELRYDARVIDGQVVDADGKPIEGCSVNEDGYVVDAYWNVIDPMTGTLAK